MFPHIAKGIKHVPAQAMAIVGVSPTGEVWPSPERLVTVVPPSPPTPSHTPVRVRGARPVVAQSVSTPETLSDLCKGEETGHHHE